MIALHSTWALLSICLLLYILVNVDQKDADIVFVVGMTVLTFPVGIVVALLIAGILGGALMLLGVEVANTMPFYLLVWSAYMAAGYAQWFLFLPIVRSRLQSRVTSGRSDP